MKFTDYTAVAVSTAAVIWFSSASAQDEDDAHHEIDQIIVTATPLSRTVEELAQPTTVLYGNELAKKQSSWIYRTAMQIVDHYGFDLDTRWRNLSDECQQAILYGGVQVAWQSSSDRGSWSGEWENEGVVSSTRPHSW